jgi:hypothetical protein
LVKAIQRERTGTLLLPSRLLVIVNPGPAGEAKELNTIAQPARASVARQMRYDTVDLLR